MSDSLTSGPHNDFVGGEASRGRIPGAEKATTGHYFVGVDLSRDQKRHADALRAEEHMPPPTGRDAPPARHVPPGARSTKQGGLPSDILNARARAHAQHPPSPSPPRQMRDDGLTVPLAPVPGSETVVDKDPFATPTSAADTLTGATSQEAYNNASGRPGYGMTSAEMHHDGKPHRKRRGGGTDQYGAGTVPGEL